MSMKDFLEKMAEEGKRLSGGGGIGMIGKVLIQTGFHSYDKENQTEPFFHFWTEVENFSDMEAKAAEHNTKLKEAGYNTKSNFGVRVTLFKDSLLTPYNGDSDVSEFTSEWTRDAYKLIAQSVDENGLPLRQEFWGQVQYKANPWHVAKGEAGKRVGSDGVERFPNIRVPVRKFADEAEAKAFVAANGTAQAETSNPFSEKATTRYRSVTGGDADTIKNIRANVGDISVWLWKAFKGEALTGYELPEFEISPTNQAIIDKSTDGTNLLWQPGLAIPLQLLEYLGEIWDMEQGDILRLQSEVPF